MKGENKASEKGRDVRKGHQPETVQSVERVGGSTKESIHFPVHDHHEHCDVHGPGGRGTKG